MAQPGSTIETYLTADQRRLALRRYAAAADPLAHVVLLHGIISHSGWYDVSCRDLTQHGFEVHALDRRGSGLNADACGDVDSMAIWISDVLEYLMLLKRAGKPIFLLGVSWGGKLAPAVARARPDLLAGLGMLCPGIYARQQPSWLQRSVLRLSGPLGINRPSVRIPLQAPELFTDSVHWQRYIRHDPLTLRRITLRFARHDLELTHLTRSSAPYLHLPSLLVLAGRDRIVDNRRTQRYFSNFAAVDKTLLQYSGAAHTLEFEADPQPYIDDLAAWLRHRVG
jgi:acylglycerol lipase